MTLGEIIVYAGLIIGLGLTFYRLKLRKETKC